MKRQQSSIRLRAVVVKHKMAVIPAVAILTSLGAHAASFDTGNEDLTVRLDTQVRLTAGVRMEKQDPRFLNDPSVNETESRFGKGDFFTKRLDLLSDLDITYKRRHGLRISAAAWSDAAYDASARSSIPGGNNYADEKLGSYANRYVRGTSGELLDAFVFTGFDVGSTGIALKAGRHTVYWGESLFAVADGIAYSQGPINQIKAASNPGSEAKELFMPTNQLSAQVQVSDSLTFAAQYMLGWKPYRLVPGGTYFASTDALRADFANTPAGPVPAFGYLPVGSDLSPKNSGNYGLSMRWKPETVEGTLGVYYRQFDDGVPWSVISTSLRPDLFGTPVGTIPDPLAARAFRLAYGRQTKLVGLSYSTNVLGASVGSELSYRKNAALRATPYAVQSATGAAEYDNARGPQGNTMHALINAIATLRQGPLWDQGIIAAELAYTGLQSVTFNPDDAIGRLTSLLGTGLPSTSTVFQGAGNAACDVADRPKQCATRSAWSMNVAFTPQWNQVFPSWDIGLPMTLGYGIKGTAATIAGTVEGRMTWSMGVNAVYQQRHQFALRYSDFREKNSALAANVQNNHGNLIFTFKTSF
jgi:hypothetical protein